MNDEAMPSSKDNLYDIKMIAEQLAKTHREVADELISNTDKNAKNLDNLSSELKSAIESQNKSVIEANIETDYVNILTPAVQISEGKAFNMSTFTDKLVESNNDNTAKVVNSNENSTDRLIKSNDMTAKNLEKYNKHSENIAAARFDKQKMLAWINIFSNVLIFVVMTIFIIVFFKYAIVVRI